MSIILYLLENANGIRLPSTPIFRILSLSTALMELASREVDIADKINELRNNLKGNYRAFLRFNLKSFLEAGFRIARIIEYLSDVASETRFALCCGVHGYQVRIGTKSDVLLDNKIRVELKIVRGRSDLP